MSVIFKKYRVCLVALEREDHGKVRVGTGFHVGDGYIVTARHVVEGAQRLRVSGYQQREVSVRETFFHPDELVDIAILATDLDLSYYMTKTLIVGVDWSKTDHLPLGVEWDDCLDDSLVLHDVVVMGFPPIPMSFPTLVATRAQINAVADHYPRREKHAPPCFILSGVPRGGFSGAPMIVDFGDGSFVLGVVTTALESQSSALEPGFMAAVTIESVLDTLHHHRIYPGENALSVKAFASEPSPEEEEEFLGPKELRESIARSFAEALDEAVKAASLAEEDDDRRRKT